MRRVIGKFLAIALTLCLLLGAVPIVSAANAYFINFSYNNENFGWSRTSTNATIANAGSAVTVYVFPDEGCLVDKVTVTDTTNNVVLDAQRIGTFEDGLTYRFTMPEGEVNVHSSFKVDNDSGYHTFTLSCSEGGSAQLKLNGLNISKKEFAAKNGDKILLSSISPDEGYSNDGIGYYYTSQGGIINVSNGNFFSMPDYDITLYIDFDKLHDIRFVTSGGNAVALDYISRMFGQYVELTSQSYDKAVYIEPTPDSEHNNTGKIRVVSDSGVSLLDSRIESDYNTARMFSMPDEPVTVYVTFLKDSYDITCSAEHGTLGYSAADGTGAGKSVTLNVQPDEGYGLKELYYTYTPESGLDEVKENIDVNGDLSFTVPEADVEVHAVFAAVRRAQWLDGDGSLLDSATYIEGADLPTTDKTPVKEGGPDYYYEFSGWQAPVYYGTDLTVFRPNFNKFYSVSVASGTAEPSKAKAGDKVTLTPDPAPNGMYFAGWRVESGNVEINNNTFIMPDSSVALYPKYERTKDVELGMDFSDDKGYVGKPFTVSGSIKENDAVIDVGGTVTVTFSNGSFDSEGAVSYTTPVENGEYVCNVPALTKDNKNVWVEYSGFGEYSGALVMNNIYLYEVSFSDLTVNIGEGNVKTVYNACDELDVTDLSIWYYWTDGTEEYYPVTASMVSGFDNTKSGTQTLAVASPYPGGGELNYKITMTKKYRTNADEEINLDGWFSRDEEDEVNFGIGNNFKHFQLLGVQKKNNENRDIRFIAVLNNEVAQDADEYGFIAAKGSSSEEAAENLKGVTYNTAKNIYDCKGTSNSVSGDYGIYKSSKDYKYITFAVNNIGDKAAAVRFYVKKGGKVYYADYINKQDETKEVCSADWAALTEGA